MTGSHSNCDCSVIPKVKEGIYIYIYDFADVRGPQNITWSLHNACLKILKSVTCYILLGCSEDAGSNPVRNVGTCKPVYLSPYPKTSKPGLYSLYKGLTWGYFGPCPVPAKDHAISSSPSCIRELVPRDLSPSHPAVHDKTFPFSDHVFSISQKHVILRVFDVTFVLAAMHIWFLKRERLFLVYMRL